MMETPYRPAKSPGHTTPVYISMPPPRRGGGGRGCCCYCCCIFWILIVVIIFAVVIAASIIYLMYDPKPPTFRMQSFRIPYFNVTEKADGAYLDADTVVRVEVRNPNGKIRLEFGATRLRMSVEDGDVGLGTAEVAAVTVKENEMASVKAETHVRGEAVEDRYLKSLKGKFERKEVVPRVEATTKIGLNLQGWKIGKLKIIVVCGGVSWLDLERDQVPKCTITALKWIKI